jgi:hypothetical protein
MNLSDYLERWGKNLLERPLAASAHPDDPPELAEIRHAVLDEVRQKSYRAGAVKVFPFETIRVQLRGVEIARAEIFKGRFFRNYLEQEIRNTLAGAATRHPESMRVEVEVAIGLPGREESWIAVQALCPAQPEAGSARARLVVREGTANKAELALENARTNIGREVDVYRNQGLHRRNDLAFVEDTEINRTVSREHAHIQRDPVRGECRLFNDRWYARGAECGTWIVRDGMSQEVHRDARGVKLEPGDEIHFGRAAVVFEAGAENR